MRQSVLLSAASLACFAAVAIAGQQDAGATAVDTRLDDAAGMAVVASLREQFDGRAVEFKLGTLDAERVNLRDLSLAGQGRIRIEGGGDWLPVRFEALYDSGTETVFSPAISLDRNPVAAPEAPAGLDRAVDVALASEFESQAVAFELESAWRTGGGERYAVVDGQGIARFEGEGAAEVQVQAVYDLADEKWVHVGYVLGGEPIPAVPAFASR